MEYDPRSIYQSYAQYGKQKGGSKSDPDASDPRGVGQTGVGLGAPSTSTKKDTKKTTSIFSIFDKDDKRSISEKLDTAFVQTLVNLIPDFNTKPKPVKEEPNMYLMDFYSKPQFVIPEPKPIVVTTLPSTSNQDSVAGMPSTANFGTSMGVDSNDPRGRDQRAMPQTGVSSNYTLLTGNKDTPVSTASPRKPGIMEAGAQFGPGEPESQPVVNTETVQLTHKVKSGDTLSQIARKYGTTVDKLVKINNLKDKTGDTIFAGDTLKITDKINEAIDAKEAAAKFSGPTTSDPDSEFYQSGVPMDQRIFEPELGADMENIEGYDDVPQVLTGLMSKTNMVNKDFDTVKDVQQRLNDLGYTTLLGPLAVDGVLGKGTARQLRKFQAEAGLPITAKEGAAIDAATKKALKNNNFYNKEGKDPSAKVTRLQDGMFEVVRPIIAQIESGGEVAKGRDPYLVAGGKNDAYDGKFQLGKDAKDTIKFMRDENGERIFTAEEREKLNHPSNRADFRGDKDLQEKAFRALTEFNHGELTRNSKKYREMDEANKLAVLGYAHNQGAEAALEWLSTKVVGTDAFGTRGDKYTKAITEEFMKEENLG